METMISNDCVFLTNMDRFVLWAYFNSVRVRNKVILHAVYLS